MQLATDLGFRHCPLAHPPHTPYGASLSFDRCAHLWLLLHTPSRAFQRLASLWLSRGIPPQCTCLFSVGFPLSGPQVWTCTSCSLFMPDTRAHTLRFLKSPPNIRPTRALRCCPIRFGWPSGRRCQLPFQTDSRPSNFQTADVQRGCAKTPFACNANRLSRSGFDFNVTRPTASCLVFVALIFEPVRFAQGH